MSNMADEYAYPFDGNGTSPDNLVTGEQQILTPPNYTDFYFIIPDFAPFYQDGLVVTHQPSGTVLTEGVDYHLTHQFNDATLETAKAVYGSITILDKTLAGVLELDYQTIGGLWTLDETAIIDILTNTTLNPRITTWEQVAGLPEAFPPIDHVWNTDDLVGMSEVVDAISAIAIQLGGSEDPGESHLSRTDNPHSVTKNQVGLGNVQNYLVANLTQAQEGTANNAYMTPLRTMDLIAALGLNNVGSHISRVDNPHGVSKAQVGLGSVENYGIATASNAVGGVDNASYMTPLRTREAIDNVVGNSLNSHVINNSNPHGVTKTQVGLSNVENYGIATDIEAIDGIDNNSYMTPLRTKQAIDAQVSTDVGSHANDTSNPHEVTKAQVGLSNLENYPVSTEVQARAGTFNNVYMTPLRTAQAIESLATASIGGHTSDNDNPHDVTATQVGLGNVSNFPIATQNQAEAGISNGTYMTPLRTAQAIAELATGGIDSHVNNVNNPHSVTKGQIGLGQVENNPVATKIEAEGQLSNTTYMTPLRTSESIDVTMGELLNTFVAAEAVFS